jgi:protein-S-isoprenylcysteine O-methyltransferase Ste14
MIIAFLASCITWLSWELWLNLRDRGRVDATDDKKSGLRLLLLLVTAMGLAAMMQETRLLAIPLKNEFKYLTGTAFVLGGAFLRLWAFRSLGKYFRTVLEVQAGQKVINRGPYRFVCHPAYAGALLVFAGFGFGLGSWPGLGVMLAFTFTAYHRRIRLEEQMMIACFQQEYLSFMRKTRRLIPFVY